LTVPILQEVDIENEDVCVLEYFSST
jgi:hypothetical protein